jgi:hypothetical protein
MAVITITPASVLPPTTSTTAVFNSFPVIAGETLVAGDWVYKKTSDSKYWKADNSTAEKSTVAGMCACGAAAGQRFVLIQRDSALPIGDVVTQGRVYSISSTPGKMVNIEDVIGTGDIYLVPLAQAVVATQLSFNCTTPTAGIVND